LPATSIRQRALAGETIAGAMIFEFFVPGISQILRNAGAEYAIYDMEHGGLSNFLGIPGQFDNPAFRDAVARIVAAAKSHGKALGFMASDANLARHYNALGFNLIASGTDQGLLIAGVRGILQSLGAKP